MLTSLLPGLAQKPLKELKLFLHRLHAAGKALDLSHMELSVLPANALIELAHLQELRLSNNKLSSLPEAVGSLLLTYADLC